MLLVVLVGFFFSSKLWMGDDRGNKDVNYDNTIILANAWEVKITDGFYDPETGVLEVKYYAKARQGSKAEPPMLRINLEGTRHQMEALITDMDDNEYGKWIQIQNVPRNWYYIRFTLKCKQESEETAVSTVDQFGHQSSHEANLSFRQFFGSKEHTAA